MVPSQAGMMHYGMRDSIKMVTSVSLEMRVFLSFDFMGVLHNEFNESGCYPTDEATIYLTQPLRYFKLKTSCHLKC